MLVSFQYLLSCMQQSVIACTVATVSTEHQAYLAAWGAKARACSVKVMGSDRCEPHSETDHEAYN